MTPPATDLTPIARLLALFDALAEVPHPWLDLFEQSCPGATHALRLWAGGRDLKLDESGTCVRCDVANYGRITIHV